MSAPRIVVAGTLPPTVGGIATVVGDHIRWLRGAGWDVAVLNTGARRRRDPGRPSLENVVAVGRDAARLLRTCRRHRPGVVAVHTVGSPALPAVRALALALAVRAAGAPLVLHLHAFDLEEQVARGSSTFRRLFRRLCRTAALVVVLHEAMAVAVRDAAPGTTLLVLPNCVPVGGEPARPTERRVVFVGTVGERKGVPTLLDAVAALPDEVSCDLVGGHGEEPVERYEAIVAGAAAAGLSSRVRFLGELDHDEVAGVLRSARTLALPSRAEGLPMAVLEALAAGVPVVVTDAGAMGSMVRTSGCGEVVAPGDADALGDALRVLLYDDERWARSAAAGLDLVEREHREDRVLPRLVARYEQLAGV